MSHVTEPRGWATQPLLERESEIRAIHRAVDELCGTSENGPTARRGGVLTFAGSAGIGKTTLLVEARRHAAERSCTVLFARGGEQEKQVPFHVMRQLIQPAFAAMTEDERRDVPRHLVQHRRPGARTHRRPGRPDGTRPAGRARRPRLGRHPPDGTQRARRPDPRRRALGGRRVPGLADRVRGAGRGTRHADHGGLPTGRDPRRRGSAARPDGPAGDPSARARSPHHDRGGPHSAGRPRPERR